MIILIPAYGRKYSTIESAHKDWLDGKDFKIAQGPYTSVRDLNALKDAFQEVVIYTGQHAFNVDNPSVPVTLS